MLLKLNYMGVNLYQLLTVWIRGRFRGGGGCPGWQARGGSSSEGCINVTHHYQSLYTAERSYFTTRFSHSLRKAA